MSDAGDPARSAARFSVGGRAAMMAAGAALSEALFFACVAGFLHGRSLWEFGVPGTLAPALPVAGALAGLVAAARRPAKEKMLTIARGAFLAGLVLLTGGVLALLLDRGMSG
ncbi:hypothetical protein [Amycolatopsis benzoatilytica]|uniref:hypothetical protein n=1 Tax=Amycolatopsis benzoatilytica TaxID=346045 RepID=UPI00037B8FD1|nr:hypothetical protein [Amycolatopsis benzoatilytica]